MMIPIIESNRCVLFCACGFGVCVCCVHRRARAYMYVKPTSIAHTKCFINP